ncbi:hypothetical protein F511_11239 [Dorcoceras hygrometricum]|uniref:Dystroglycan-like n=1 Tax=Dorcoceras hygrometricum TaxID=472368 RepID=A0A2Z7BM08_9LAMI|nr:hypothetical protein F511_11239 [Dorcoceras hygrometricum]
MASSFYSNTVHVDFESVLAMYDPGMVSMFQGLIASGLQGFLGCSTVIHEEALLEFFANGTVRDGLVVSTVHRVTVEISEQLFGEMFELPVEGLMDLTDVPKDKIFDAKSIVSLTGEPVRTSGTKSQMKIHFHLLCDIMAKSISVKAGSFNAITVEKFAMVTTVVCEGKVNWSSVLFTILKKMVTEGTRQAKGFAIQISLLLENLEHKKLLRQAKGFAIQISLLLENVPNLELGKSSEFPSSKMLTERTIHRYIVLNDKAGAQEATDAPPVKKASRKPAASKKRPAVAAAEEPVPKKKRTSKKKSGSSPSTLEIMVVAQEAMPIQMVGPSTGVPAAEEPVEQLAAEDDISADQPVDEVAGETVGEAAADKYFSLVDDPDTVINQVLNQLDSISDDKDDKQSDKAETWFDRAFDEILRNDSPVVTPSDTDEEEGTMDVGAASGDQQVQFSKEEPVVMEMNDELLDTDEQMSLEDILMTTPVDVSLPSAGMEITKIKMGKEIKIPEVNERTWFLNSLPKIPADNKGKAILVEKDPVKGNPAKEHYYLICEDISLLVKLRAQPIISSEVPSQRQYDDTLPTVSDFFKTFKKRLADVHRELAQFFITGKLLPSRYSEALNQLRASIDEIRKQDAGAKHKDTILLHLHDFEKQVIARLDSQDRVLGALCRDSNDQHNLLSLELQSSHKQLGTQLVTTGLDVVDVRRGESSNSRPLPPPADQIRDNGMQMVEHQTLNRELKWHRETLRGECWMLIDVKVFCRLKEIEKEEEENE